MSFVRRLLNQPKATPPGAASGPEDLPSDEERDRQLLREEAERLDELQQRQLRYAQYAWTPERQGGERRAEDEDPGE